ncbi:UNC93-like protein MFSD11 [Watersipora subatra]|uniref:UNC93-like protein MFSD11 n=1 Tax=Watersipora subatra TaxID=2589382 RepID=UPI00355B8138
MAVVWDRSLYNVVFIAIAFMLVFTSFQTGAMIEPVVLEDVQNETKYSPNPFTGTGYTSGFIASFLGPQTWLLYLMSVLLGIAAAIWTAQGNFLTLNSTRETMGHNSGLFWALFQCNLLFRNLFVFLELRGLTTISKSTRTVVYGGLAGTAVLGTLLLLVLQKPPNSDDQATVNEAAFSIMLTGDMLLLFLSFFYTGLELTFFSGVYGTCITHTAAFAQAKDSYIGYSSMLIGAGEILALLSPFYAASFLDLVTAVLILRFIPFLESCILTTVVQPSLSLQICPVSPSRHSILLQFVPCNEMAATYSCHHVHTGGCLLL